MDQFSHEGEGNRKTSNAQRPTPNSSSQKRGLPRAGHPGYSQTMAQPAKYLLIDISNSFTKLAFATRERISKPNKLPTDKLRASLLQQSLRGREVDLIVVCSVVPKKNAAVRSAAKGRQILWLTPQTKLGVGIDYPNPKTIGADRLANAAAVAALYRCPAIVVDFG